MKKDVRQTPLTEADTLPYEIDEPHPGPPKAAIRLIIDGQCFLGAFKRFRDKGSEQRIRLESPWVKCKMNVEDPSDPGDSLFTSTITIIERHYHCQPFVLSEIQRNDREGLSAETLSLAFERGGAVISWRKNDLDNIEDLRKTWDAERPAA